MDSIFALRGKSLAVMAVILARSTLSSPNSFQNSIIELSVEIMVVPKCRKQYEIPGRYLHPWWHQYSQHFVCLCKSSYIWSTRTQKLAPALAPRYHSANFTSWPCWAETNRRTSGGRRRCWGCQRWSGGITRISIRASLLLFGSAGRCFWRRGISVTIWSIWGGRYVWCLYLTRGHITAGVVSWKDGHDVICYHSLSGRSVLLQDHEKAISTLNKFFIVELLGQ